MNSLTAFDIVILGITLILGLKGLFRGLVKEVFGIIAIIGAIFVASRMSSEVGDLVAPILGLTGERTIGLAGFIIALVGFWIIIYLIGSLISKILSASGLGIFDRLLGFVFGAAKIFMIFSVIAYGLYQINSFKTAISKNTEGSVVMPYLQSMGSKILKINFTQIVNNVGDTVDSVVDKTKDMTNSNEDKKPLSQDLKKGIDEVKDSVSETLDDVKDSVNKEISKNIKDAIDNQVDSAKEKLQNIANDNK